MSNTITKRVAIYVCPTPGCGSFYGSSSMGKIEDKTTGPPTENVFALEKATGQRHKFHRDQCPDCRQNGKEVNRIRVTIPVPVPVMEDADVSADSGT